MKLASVLAGATAVALALTATAASASGPVYQGSVTTHGFFGGTTNNSVAVLAADLLNPGIGDSTALMTIKSLGFAGNTSSASTNNGATFSLSGNVTPDCAYYIGDTVTSVNFGTIGINTSDNNPDAAFEMVGGDRTLAISSNLAGCNTRNTVTFSKTDLSNSSGAGFDAAQFTNVIPVELTASFKAGVVGATGNAGQQNVSLTATGSQAAAGTWGAWKSPLDMVVKMKNPNKGLLAGSYTGTVGVTIVAN